MADVYVNRYHVISLPTKHVRALIDLIDTGRARLTEDEWDACEAVGRVLRIEAESARLDMSVRCDQCGEEDLKKMDVGCCSKCADDFNTNPPEVGRKRINRRRQAVGLDPIEVEVK